MTYGNVIYNSMGILLILYKYCYTNAFSIDDWCSLNQGVFTMDKSHKYSGNICGLLIIVSLCFGNMKPAVVESSGSGSIKPDQDFVCKPAEDSVTVTFSTQLVGWNNILAWICTFWTRPIHLWKPVVGSLCIDWLTSPVMMVMSRKEAEKASDSCFPSEWLQND